MGGEPSVEIFDFEVCRRATESTLITRGGRPCGANALRELWAKIVALGRTCQFPELTEHGAPHLGSILDRIDTWTLASGDRLISTLSADECCVLTLAVLLHDIGMITQIEEDLPEAHRARHAAQFADTPTWVRATHNQRLEDAGRRLLGQSYEEFTVSPSYRLCASVARGHHHWPGADGFDEIARKATDTPVDPQRAQALSAVLSVADLLDEDSARCESMLLFANKAGDLLNRAHWLRHMLVQPPIRVQRGRVDVSVTVPANIAGRIANALFAMANHLGLAERYNPALGVLGAEVSIHVNDPDCGGEALPEDLRVLRPLLLQPDVHLMRTVLSDALARPPDGARPGDVFTEPPHVGELRALDRSAYDAALGPYGRLSGRTDEEITVAAAALDGADALCKALELLREDVWLAHSRGDGARVMSAVDLALDTIGGLAEITGGGDWRGTAFTVPGEAAQWLAVLALHWTDHPRWVQTLCWGLREVRATASILWRVVRYTALTLQGRAEATAEAFDTLLEEALAAAAPMTIDAALAWHDCIEAAWARGLLTRDDGTRWGALRALANPDRHTGGWGVGLLRELLWRLRTQSRCFHGFGRLWLWKDGVTRKDFDLPPSPGVEAMAEFWGAWFFAAPTPKLKAHAADARLENPPGTALHAPALAAELLATFRELEDQPAVYSERHHFRVMRAQAEGYPAQALSTAKRAILSARDDPRRDGEHYVGGRRVDVLSTAMLLGERMALRRWDIEGWAGLLSTNTDASLARAYAMNLEGESVVGPVFNALIDVNWAQPYRQTGVKTLAALLPSTELQLDRRTWVALAAAMRESPERVAGLDNPVLPLAADNLPRSFVATLLEWTERALESEHVLLRAALAVWGAIAPHANLTREEWTRLSGLIPIAAARLYAPGGAEALTFTALRVAPWHVAKGAVRVYALALNQETLPEHVASWLRTTVLGTLRYREDRWRTTAEGRALALAFRRRALRRGGLEDAAAAEALGRSGEPSDQWPGRMLLGQLVRRLRKMAWTVKNDPDAAQHGFGQGAAWLPRGAMLNPAQLRSVLRSLRSIGGLEGVSHDLLDSAARFAAWFAPVAGPFGSERILLALLRLASRASRISRMGRLQPDGSWIAWTHLRDLVPEMSPRVLAAAIRVASARVLDSPLKSASGLGATAMAGLIRGADAAARRQAGTVLANLMARLLERPEAAPVALWYITRELYLTDVSVAAPDIGDALAACVTVAARAADPMERSRAAYAVGVLVDRVPPRASEALRPVLERLRRDPRMRVRRAARSSQRTKPQGG